MRPKFPASPREGRGGFVSRVRDYYGKLQPLIHSSRVSAGAFGIKSEVAHYLCG